MRNFNSVIISDNIDHNTIYVLNVLEVNWVNNFDIQLQAQITCIGYNFIFLLHSPVKNC
jgi:hypothetical protein